MTRQRGSALVVALLMLTIAQALVLAVTTRAILASHAAVRAENRARALNAAEAGLADAVQRMIRDNVASNGHGEMGLTSWDVAGTETLVEPNVSLATFVVKAQCREQSSRIRLRVVVRRDELFAITAIDELDWTPM